MKYCTLVIYKSGRKEVLHHPNEGDMKETRLLLSKLNTVAEFKTPTPKEKADVAREKAARNQTAGQNI